MADDEAIIRAAGRFWLAWIAATKGGPLPSTDPAVVAVHDAAQDLIRTTETENLRAAYDVVDALVARIEQAQPDP